MSLDGVMQAPGGPRRRPDRRIHARRLGGQLLRRRDDGSDAEAAPYELLLGRGTYEIFAAHWPYADGPIADRLNGTRKHVASTTLEQVEWNNSTLIPGDVAEYVAALKSQDGPEIQVHGSPGLIQTLLEHDLIDEYRMWIFPVVIGPGKRFFGDGTIPAALKLVEQQGHQDRRHDQHLPSVQATSSSGRSSSTSHRGRDRAAQGPLVTRALVAPAHGLLVAQALLAALAGANAD